MLFIYTIFIEKQKFKNYYDEIMDNTRSVCGNHYMSI